MDERDGLIKQLDMIAEYFAECRDNAAKGSAAEEHFWALENAARAAREKLMKEKADE